MNLKQSEVNKVEKTNYYIMIYLVDYSKHFLYCLFAKPDFTCYPEQTDLEELLYSYGLLHRLLRNLASSASPHLVVVEYKMLIQTRPGIAAFQELPWFRTLVTSPFPNSH